VKYFTEKGDSRPRREAAGIVLVVIGVALLIWAREN